MSKRAPNNVRRNPKRSCTLEIKPRTSMGLFGSLPEEITQKLLLHYVPVESLYVLAMTSTSMCSYIRDLIMDAQLIIQPVNRWIESRRLSRILGHFSVIGKLFKSTSVFLKISEKLTIIEVFLYKIENTYDKICQQISLKFAYRCIGQFLYYYTSTWDKYALKRVFALIKRLSNLDERIDKVVYAKPGTLPRAEMDIRNFAWEVFLPFIKFGEKIYNWESETIVSQGQSLVLFIERCPANHSQLLYVLFAPTIRRRKIDWDIFCDSDTTNIKAEPGLESLVDAISLLMIAKSFYGPSDSVIVEFVNGLMNTPAPWSNKNKVLFLYMLGRKSHKMTVQIIHSVYLNGEVERFREFGRLIPHLVTLHDEFPESRSWFVNVMLESIMPLRAPKSTRAYHLINEMTNGFQEQLDYLTNRYNKLLQNNQKTLDLIQEQFGQEQLVQMMEDLFEERNRVCDSGIASLRQTVEVFKELNSKITDTLPNIKNLLLLESSRNIGK